MIAPSPRPLPRWSLILQVSRPKFWLYLAGTYLLGCAAGTSRPQELGQPIFWLFLAFFALPANVLLYGINDLFDAAADRYNPRKSGGEHLLQDAERKGLGAAILVAGAVGGALLLLLPSPAERLWLGGFLGLSVLYSAPPIRFKARPFLDSASNVLYAFPLFLGYQQFSGHPVPTPVFLSGFLWTAAMHLFSAVPDIACDRQAGLRTSATVLGYRGSLLTCALLWTGTALVCARGRLLWPWGLGAFVYPMIPLLLLFHPKLDLDRTYALFPLLNAGAGMTAFWASVLRL